MPSAPTRITESVVEQAALDWLGGLGYEVLSGLAIAPGEPAAERADYKQVFLFDRLQTKLEDLNPKIPLEGLQEALRKLRLFSLPTLIEKQSCVSSAAGGRRGCRVSQPGRPDCS
jgi:type I restriction enzyme R subunit